MLTNNNKQRQTCFISISAVTLLSIVLFWMYNINASDSLTTKPATEELYNTPLCTFAFFRRYNAEQHYFPSGGEWTKTNETVHFNPKICRYLYPRIPEAVLEKCLLKAGIRSVLVSGDSTGRRNHVALVKSVGNKCQALKDTAEEAAFYRGAITDLPSAFGFTKIDDKRRCQLPYANGSRYVYFERMEHSHMPNTKTSIKRLTSATGYPDLFLVFLPFFHIKRQPLKSLKTRIKIFLDEVKHVIPKSARIVYVNTYSEFESARRGKTLFLLNRRYENMLAAEKILKMNHILYQELEKDLLNASSRIHSFLDLFSISLGRDKWCIDGIHMLPVWHDSIMSMLWETYCNSVFLNQF